MVSANNLEYLMVSISYVLMVANLLIICVSCVLYQMDHSVIQSLRVNNCLVLFLMAISISIEVLVGKRIPILASDH